MNARGLRRAVFTQLNRQNILGRSLFRSSWSAGGCPQRLHAWRTRIPADFPGQHKARRLPRPSGSDVSRLQTTGVPHAMASSTVKPKPSYRDGQAYTFAAEYNARNSESPTMPVKITLSRIPSSSASRPNSGSPSLSGPTRTRVACFSLPRNF